MENSYPSLILYVGKMPGLDVSALRENLRQTQDALFSELGVIVPLIQVEMDEMLPDGTFRLKINSQMQEMVAGLDMGEYWVYMSRETYQEYFAGTLGAQAEEFSVRDSVEPNSGSPAIIIKPSPAVQAMFLLTGKDLGSIMREVGLDVRDRLGYITFCVAADLRRNVADLVTAGLTRYLLSKLEAKAPALVVAISQEIGLQGLTQELQRRVAARQSIHDLPAILDEMLVAWAQAPTIL